MGILGYCYSEVFENILSARLNLIDAIIYHGVIYFTERYTERGKGV